MRPSRNLDLRLLVYFQKTAEIGNITKAAENLNVAQPTLSKALQLFESQLGVALFDRHSHGVSLTPIGKRLLQHSRVVMAQVNDAAKEVEMLRVGTSGHVRIGAGPSWVRRKLPQAISDVLRDRPKLTASVASGFDEHMFDSLKKGELDFVVAEKPLGGANSNFEYVGLTSDALVVCAAKSHPLARLQNVSIDQALTANWALPPSHTLARRKLDANLVLFGATPPTPAIVSSSHTFLLEFARNFETLLYMTRSSLETAEGSGLVEIDVPDLTSVREAGIVFRKPMLLTAAVQSFVDRLKEICAKEPIN